MSKIRVNGMKETDGSRTPSVLGRSLPKGAVSVKHSVRVGFAREGHAPVVLDEVGDDDIVELELSDGLRLWSRADDLTRDCGLAVSRDAGSGDILELGTQLSLGGPSQSRGVGDWVIRGLKVLGVDVAGEITEFVADKVEGQLTPGPGLYRCSAKSPSDLSAPRKLKGTEPVLLFVHGTGSTFEGGFKALWGAADSRIAELERMYGDRMLALQHRTLTESPIENTRDLVKALGKVVTPGTELHVVTHSRGGLIGELLVRGNRVGGAPFDRDDLSLFKGADRRRDLEALTELRDLLAAERYRVGRFVRVACPTRGTTLADRRLDRYLSVILNVLEHIPGLQESVLFDTFSSLLAAVLKKRTDPRELPGIEAMMPESPLVRMLNRPGVRCDSPLRILGGDVEGTGFWGRLKTFATDLYYREDHDLVVNTPAMFGGAERVGVPKYWVDTGGRVNHFNYFANADTASKLVGALANDAAPGYHDVEVPLGTVTEDDYRKRSPVPQPVVFVLPGIMGSTLAVDDNRVWVDKWDLAIGGMAQLKNGAPKVAAESLIEGSYRDLVRHLAATHDVVPFPYDWRVPIAVSAERLRTAIDARLDALDGTNQPVRIVAHSMGGLVVRAMIGTPEGRKTWDRMRRHSGARFIMLGTPNGGSHAIGAMLMGRDSLVKQLSLLDLRHSYAELLAIIAEFDGALQLLPHTGTLDLLDVGVWKTLHLHDAPQDRGIFGSTPADPSKSAKVAWSIPAKARLDQARETATLIANSPVDADRMIYVAGVAPATPIDIRIDEHAPEGHRVTVLATERGDGRVPWATGIPDALTRQTYYMAAQHGDLANTEDAFPAIVDLLDHGTTSKLPQTAPAGRGADGAAPFVWRSPDVDVFPDEASLIAAATGGRGRRRRVRTADRVTVRVRHENLVKASSPVLVGHYRDDVFVGAEDFLDHKLNGRLRELHQLDVYPGPFNTAAVVLNDTLASARGLHPGAIVVGLGTVGELTPGALSATLTYALTRYGAEVVGRERRRRQLGVSKEQSTDIPVGITALLIGAGTGGVKLADSLQAILRAVLVANARHASLSEGAPSSGDTGDRLTMRIASVDVFELFEDRAIQAVRELQALARAAEFRSAFVIDEVLVPGKDGQRRASFDELPGWWQRLRITRRPEDDALVFEALTDRARTEMLVLPTQQRVVRRLLTQASQSTGSDLELSATLFELLVPRALKEQAPDRRDIVLLVDPTSAEIPWELMRNRWDAASSPLSVASGMVRQLSTAVFRPTVQRAPGDTALVIGDPPLDGSPEFAQLPGAAAESTAVAAMLRDRGFEVTALVNGNAEWSRVLGALYGQPYRVLHIAAHGVHEYVPGPGEKPVSGVVLGPGVFLTQSEVEQMRVVPDLVFINCCHLAADGSFGRTPDRFPELAANLAQQFIRMGVRGVVAAGWAVDDQAAKEFARVFYREMLAGMEFGRAVKSAREEIYARFGAVNTWGAYQCYGDPGYLLRPARGSSTPRTFVAEREFRYEVERVAGMARGDTRKWPTLRARLDQLVATAQPAWLTSGSTAATLALAYADIEQFDAAVEYLDRVLTAEPATASLRAVEQLANTVARLAAKQKKVRVDLMERSAALLQHLTAIGETAERLSLGGATAKRTAMRATTKTSRLAALKLMASAYERAFARASKTPQSNAWYPLANLVAAQVAQEWQSAAKAPRAAKAAQKAIDENLERLRTLAAQVPGSSSDIWELFLPTDVELLEAAHHGTIGKAQSALARAYAAAAARAGTPKEKASAKGQAEFLRDMAKTSSRTGVRALAKGFDDLVAALDGPTER